MLPRFVILSLLWVYFSYNGFSRNTEIPIPDSLYRKVAKANTGSDWVSLVEDAIFFVYNHPDTAYILCRKIVARSQELEVHLIHAKAHDIIGVYFQNQGRYDSAMSNYLHSLRIRESLDNPKAVAESYNNFGVLYRRRGVYDSSLYYYQEALQIANELQDTIMLGNYNNNIGLVLENQGKLDLALQHHLRSLRLREASGNQKGIAGSLNNIGIVYQRIGDYRSSLDYLRQSLVIKRRLNNRRMISSAHISLGNSYYRLAQYDSALYHQEAALTLAMQLGDKRAMAVVYNNLAHTWWRSENPDQALTYAQDAVKMHRELGNATDIVSSLHYLVDILLHEGRLENAREAGKEAYEVAVKSEEVENIRLAAQGLALTFERLGNVAQAYHYFKIYSQYQDSLLNRQKLKSIAEAREKYETEKKDQEISLLNKEAALQDALLNQRSTQRNLLLVGIFSLGLIAFLLIRNYRLQIKARDMVNKKGKELESMRSRFFANISHEFRTPLTLIAGPIQDLMDHTGIGDEKRKQLRMAEQNTQRLQRLIDQLLDLSKLESGKLELIKEEKEVFQFLHTLISSFKSMAEQANIRFSYHVPNQNVRALIDADKWEVIVYNLLSNAFKFTPQNGEISVLVEKVEEKTPRVRIVVKDTGSGLTEEEKSKVFDRFYQTEESIRNQVEGTGIGLALTYELVTLMQGTIAVDSEKGKGSVFTVLLPAEVVTANDLTATHEGIGIDDQPVMVAEPHSEEGVIKTSDLPHILLVEDNPDLKVYLKQCLGEHYHYIEAGNGIEGLSLALHEVPDIIISDVMMPGMDGIQFCEKAKNSPETNHIPFIMLTAKAGTDDKLEGLKTGADDYITKPFDKQELKLKVSNLLERRKSLQERLKAELLMEPESGHMVSQEERFIGRLKSILEQHLTNSELSVDFLSKEMGLSRVQLYRKIHALTNLSVVEFVRTIRLKKAKMLIEQNWGTVSDIAYEVGYNNLSYFSKNFKEMFGKSPSQWLQEWKNKA